MAYLHTAAGQARETGAENQDILAAVPMAAVADLTAGSGTSDGTVADVGASFNQTTLNNNFQDVATKVNLILARLRTAGLLTP